MNQAIQLQPQNPNYYNNLGNVLREQGNLAEAVRIFRQAIELEPNFVQAYCNLGLALKEKGDLAGAAQAYRQALLLKPGNSHYGKRR